MKWIVGKIKNNTTLDAFHDIPLGSLSRKKRERVKQQQQFMAFAAS